MAYCAVNSCRKHNMKILAVCSNFHVPVGGIKQVVRRVGEELVKKNHQYTVLTINAGNSQNEDWDNGILIVKLPYSRFNVIGDRESLNIVFYLQRNLERFDIVNVHNYYSIWSLMASFLCKQKAFPCVFTPHYQGIRGTKKGVYKLVYDAYSIIGRLAFGWADKIICDSEYEKNLIKQGTEYLIAHGKS